MEVIIEQGKTVDEAVEKALERLDAKRDDVECKVIQSGKKGILGFIGARSAIVKVSLKKKKKRKSILKETKYQYEKRTEAKEISGNDIRDIISTVLVSMGFDPTITYKIKHGVYFFDIDVEDKFDGLLIGRRGKTLGALQHIVNRLIHAEQNNSYGSNVQIVLDISGYRKRRDDMLISKAKNLARKVKKTGNEVVLDPLHPSDRRVVHTALNKDPKVKTYTVGKGPYRNIIIAPTD
jgi:spoIIIJ-associated protein